MNFISRKRVVYLDGGGALSRGKTPPNPPVSREGQWLASQSVLDVWSQPLAFGAVEVRIPHGTIRLWTGFAPPSPPPRIVPPGVCCISAPADARAKLVLGREDGLAISSQSSL